MAARLDSIDLLNVINQENLYDRISGWGTLINPVLQDKFIRYCMAKKSLLYVFIIKIMLTVWALMDSYISLEVYGHTPFQIFFARLSMLFVTISWITAIILEYFATSKELILNDWHALIQAVFILSINATVGIKFLKYAIYTPLPDNAQYSEGALNFISLHTASGFAVAPVIMTAIIYEPRFYLSAFCTTFVSLGIALANGISAPTILSGLIRLIMLLILFYQIQNQRLVAFLNHIMLIEMLEEREKNADALHALEMRHMIGNVAHDLKTPLSAFMNGIDMMRSLVNQISKKLLSGSFTSEEVTESCQMMHDAMNNIYNTNTFMLMEINRCVDYTKAIKGIKLIPNFEVVDVREVMKYCADVMMCMQERIRVIASDLGKDINPFVKTDKRWLQENILCLLSNAVKYASVGPVSLRVTLVEDRPFKAAVDLSLTCEKPGPAEASLSQKTHSFSRDSLDEDTGKNLLIEVEDDGPGVDENSLQNIFTPFKQAKRLVGGTGLGLFSLAKRIESLSTSYGVKKRENGEHGSIFWFTIPNVPDNERFEKELASPVDPTSIQKENACLPPESIPHSVDNHVFSYLIVKQSPLSTPYSTYSVLVVDDSPTILKLCSMSLRKIGFIVQTAENGAVAVTKVGEEIKKTGKGFDLILMDIQMPVMDGLEATKKIRTLEKSESTPFSDGVTSATSNVSSALIAPPEASQGITSVPPHQLIFGVSANSDQETMQEAFEVGVDDFLGKPFTMDALTTAFTNHLREITEGTQTNISGKSTLDNSSSLSSELVLNK